jgi:N-methylhydantoinase B
METSGGGGFGPPANRSQNEIEADLHEGYMTAERAQRVHGYVAPPASDAD